MRGTNAGLKIKFLKTTALTTIGPALAGAALALAVSTGTAQADEWVGAVSADWFSAGNWADGSVPIAIDDVVVDTVPPAPIINGGAASAGELTIGDTSGASLIIHNGGTLTSGSDAYLGRQAGGYGLVKVLGSGTAWDLNSNSLYLGPLGTGELVIDYGGFVQTGATFLASGSGGSGTLRLNATVGHRGALETGHVGKVLGPGAGQLIFDGGILRATRNSPTFIGGFFAPGDIMIDSGGAYIDTNGWDVGFQSPLGGPGELVKQGEGTVVLFTPNTHGSTRVSEGTLSVYGATASVTHAAGDMIVGDQAGSLADLLITGGGSVWGNSTYVGRVYGSEGGATVRGSGSQWINDGGFYIGAHGKGTLNIENGGSVVSNGLAAVGREAGGVGMAMVTGSGSTWTTNGFLNIGDQPDSQGTLTIADQGTVISNSQVRLANAPDTHGTVLVTGAGSKWINSDQFAVGFWDKGALFIADGGEVSGSTYTSIGTWDGSTGTVDVTGSGSRWQVTGDLAVGRQGSGRLAIEDGGTVSNGNGIIGEGADAVGAVTVTGSGSNWTNSGTLFIGSAGAGILTVGAGATVSAGGAISIADQIGSTGTVIVDGDLVAAGGVTVNAGGWIGGAGMVTGNTTMAGTAAPGNSIGTLTVAGNYTQSAGSTYEVEIDGAGNSDLIDVTGSTTLTGGTVEAVPLPGFAIATPYTILKAAGGISGTFDGLSGIASSAFLSPELTYDANNAFLTIAQSASFASAALTPNQKAAAEGADSLGAGNAIWDAIALLPSASEAPAAFDTVSGEIHASAQTALIEDSRFVRHAANDRIRAAFGDAGASYAPVLAYGPGDTPILVAPDHAGPAFWSRGFGSWGSTDSDGNAAHLDRSSGGLLIGADGLVGDWRLGLLAGYSHSSFDADDRASSGSSSNYHLGLYGGTQWGNLAFRTGAAYTWHDIETKRTAFFPGFADSLSAEYSAGTFQAFGELGYGIELGTGTRLEPFANLAHVNLHRGGFTEQGGPAALSVDGGSTDATFTTLGLRAEHNVMLGTIDATLGGMVGWRHAFGDITPESIHAFPTGDVFTIAGVPIARNSAVVEAGVDLNLTPDATFGLSYQGQIASDAYDHGFRASLAVRF